LSKPKGRERYPLSRSTPREHLFIGLLIIGYMGYDVVAKGFANAAGELIYLIPVIGFVGFFAWVGREVRRTDR